MTGSAEGLEVGGVEGEVWMGGDGLDVVDLGGGDDLVICGVVPERIGA